LSGSWCSPPPVKPRKIRPAASLTPVPTSVSTFSSGSVDWVALCMGAGWFFGNVPFVKEHFSLVTIGIVLVSLLPVAFEFVKSRRRP